MQKILIFGAHGMLGHVAARYLAETGAYRVMKCVRSAHAADEISADVTDSGRVREILELQRPDIVLNCVGMLIKACADDPALAIMVNSYFPQFLAKCGRDLDYKLVHVSTDCVFSGKKGSYTDTDFRDGDTVYARTKALGEIIDERNLTIRTSIVGPELKDNGTGLFHWFMRQHGEIKGYRLAFWSGVTTLELSKFIHAAIRNKLTGLYQLSMPEKISKYELLKLFQEIWRKDDVTVTPYDDYFCDKSMVGSVRSGFKYTLPADYRNMLTEMKNYMDAADTRHGTLS